MGILDDAKGRLGEAAEWVKDKAEQLGEHSQTAGHALGEKAAEARSWVEGVVGGDGDGDAAAEGRAAADTDAAAPDVERTGGGGDLANEWVDVTADPDVGGPQSDAAPPDGPQNPL